MKSILLLEDDKKIADEIVDKLERQSFIVTHVRTISQTNAIDLESFALLILDWNLPDGEGVDLVAKIRRKNIETPILMLTARTNLEDRKLATDCGVTDFLGKPFYFHELMARVSMIIGDHHSSRSTKVSEILHSGDLEINVLSREVRYKNQLISMTKKEFDLLLFLVRNPRVVFSRDEILDAVWGRGENPTNRTVDTHVLQLRKKLCAEYFETVWSSGYRYLPDES